VSTEADASYVVELLFVPGEAPTDRDYSRDHWRRRRLGHGRKVNGGTWLERRKMGSGTTTLATLARLPWQQETVKTSALTDSPVRPAVAALSRPESLRPTYGLQLDWSKDVVENIKKKKG
jgi:hypothetical protein